MREVLISIHQNWCELILSGDKTAEIRKSVPGELSPPFKCYIYCTKVGAKEDSPATPGKVIGHFICDHIYPIRVFENGTIQDWNWHNMKNTCVPYDDIATYIGNNKRGWGWQISNLKVYDEPKDLSEFRAICNGDITGKCTNCEYAYAENTEGGRYEECLCNMILPVKRPPQSWMYVYTETLE